jgi:hypothetical protein
MPRLPSYQRVTFRVLLGESESAHRTVFASTAGRRRDLRTRRLSEFQLPCRDVDRKVATPPGSP